MWPAVLRSGVRPRARLRAGTAWPVVLLIAMLALYAAVWLRALPAGADDFNLAAVFSTDEPLAGRIVRRMVDEPTLNPSHFFAYGALYHEAAAVVLLPLAPSGADQREVLLTLRGVSLLSGLATVALTFALGRRLFNPWTGLLAAALVAASTEMAEWSVTAHPDTLQLALVTAALLAICALRDSPSRALVTAAGLLAGLAFATKYGGALLLPVAVLALLCGLIAHGWWGRDLLGRLVGDAALLGGVFVAAFLATNPYAVVEWRRFLTQFRAEIEHAGQGHVTTGETSGLRWIGLVAARTFAGPLAVIAAVAGWATLWTRLPPRDAQHRWHSLASRIDAPVLIGVWTFGYLAYLVAQIGYQAPRYALPLLQIGRASCM